MIQSDMPPVSNRFLYIYRIIVKVICFSLFGLGTIVFITIIFPIMRLFIPSRKKFKNIGRKLISLAMRLFIFVMQISTALKLEVEDKTLYKNLSSKIIVANHPSLLDVVMLISLIPNADCIVNSSLSRNIVSGIISQLYISNSLDFDKLVKACSQSLSDGNCIIIFPEGTRTRRTGKRILKKGAARLSLISGCSIIPIHIGGNDKYGLGKNESLFSFNHTDKYIYRIRMQKELFPDNYRSKGDVLASKYLTADIKEAIFNPVNK